MQILDSNICFEPLFAALLAPQMGALRAGLDGTPLVLIQGPPGTGKTRTILNLLSVVMHSAAKGSLELVAKAASTAAGSGQGPGAHGGPAAAAGGADLSKEQLATAERQRVWRLQSPWMFGQPTVRDITGPASDTGGVIKLMNPSPSDFAGHNRGMSILSYLSMATWKHVSLILYLMQVTFQASRSMSIASMIPSALFHMCCCCVLE